MLLFADASSTLRGNGNSTLKNIWLKMKRVKIVKYIRPIT